MDDVLKKFGRYFLLDQIAQGGMAEIYRARLASPEGAGRLIVIKRIQGGFGSNDEFHQMFRSEIKVTMGLSHPNIVQLYDFGEESGQPYIAMELVDGKNLRQFLTRYNDQKSGFPVDLAAFIIEQAAAGLHHAHSFKDKITGQPLNIVHRDISPQNLLISYEGNVKVIDFGIAKATTNKEATRAGIIKGKPSYLSPEQITGLELDGRCDVFALGIVLWELLVGRKLFPGDSDFAVIKLIENEGNRIKPPSEHNPDVPAELDAIVLKALERNRDRRYQTAEELQRALHRFTYMTNPEFNPSELSYVARELFKNEIVEDRKRIQKLNDRAEQLLHSAPENLEIPAMGTEGATIPLAQREGDGTTTIENRSRTMRAGTAVTSMATSVEMDSSIAPRRPPAAPGGSARVSGGASVPPSMMGSGSGRARPNPYQYTQTGISRSSTRPSPSSSGGGLGRWLGTVASLAVGVAIFGRDYLPPSVRAFLPGGGKPAVVDREPAFARSRLVELKLDVSPSGKGIKAFINDQPVDAATLTTKIRVGQALELRVERPGFRTLTRQFSLSEAKVGSAGSFTEEVLLEPERFGFLTIFSTPSAEAIITSTDGSTWRKPTPFQVAKLPAGTYTIKLENKLLGMGKDLPPLRIDEGREVNTSVQLEISAGSR